MKHETPFWSWRPASHYNRNLFEVVRVIEYSSKGITTDMSVGSVYYGPSRIQKRIKKMAYSTFKKNYKDISTLGVVLKENLIISILEKFNG